MLESMKNDTKSEEDEIDPYEVLEKARQGVDIEDIKKKLKITDDNKDSKDNKDNKESKSDKKESKKEEKNEQSKDQGSNTDQFKLI